VSSSSEWLWLVDPGVTPHPDARERLLEAADDPSRPVLLASKVITPSGSLDPGSLPIPETLDPDLDADACSRGLLAIRVARPGAVLVRRDVAPSPPSGRRGFLAWSAGVLRRGPGLLVPSSVAVRHMPVHGELREMGLLVAGRSLSLREKPWFLFHLLERLAKRGSPGKNSSAA